ncbi:ABC transporter substrate binding protein [Intestinimonas butyriciproducens]|uniref:ABC transporter substrate binding protein n=1 Tax=Intestinimonas butyriciproducens TaxID=1297617 RepID=UPI0018AB1B77|nr:ABC transporter substrate binding protein [Intestinimonas butyriciproducens]MDB7816792.1 ABC transporter substrate binding protein [Intestinimonas butyriciproducens]MDB7842438.1 ABC transporter substrate binding protein [Intestinimonas butyriciproducens]MDB7857814.1 ABC transporter substrate binding protein [Intestinimonas butyriciproducens]
MKNLSKLTALLSAAAMTLSLAACSGGNAASTPAPADTSTPTDTAAPSEGATYTVGICQLVTHDALDAATQGFMDALNEALPGQVEFDVQNAAGDSNTCSTIVNSFVADGVDLILANATPALQAATAATADIPILGTSVTEYGVALNIQGFDGTVGGNVSGTSDLAPLDQQAAMIYELFPDAETVGLIYCSAEANSQYQVDTVKAELEKLGYTCELYPFADSNDAAAVTQTACDASDVIYLPTDNTVASNTGIVDNICQPAGVPVVAGEEGIVKGCGVATLSISYYDLGVTTGKMAAQILTGEADISSMPIAYAEDFTPKYNPVICEALGLTMPENYVAIDME